MKIAILTQPLGKNYGGMIQAFALQHFLVSKGHEVITIDRKLPEKKISLLNMTLFVLSRTLKKIRRKRKAPIFFEQKKHLMYRHTLRFMREHIRLSPEFVTTNTMKEYFEKENFDVVIVGSDQVWRTDYSPNIYNFFLDFISSKEVRKVSYAASFGHSKWKFSDLETAKCKELIQDFSFVSVREKDALELCKQHLMIKAEWVCDPTLLLNSSDYEKLINNYPQENKAGLFYYLLDKTTSKVALVEKVALRLNLSTLSCYPERHHLDTQGSTMEEYTYPPVEQWLHSFKHAKVVITDSFHGVIFSIIFEKPFLLFINEERGASRFLSLMKLADFEDRIIRDEPTLMKRIENEDFLNPVQVDRKFIDVSGSYLLNCLK